MPGPPGVGVADRPAVGVENIRQQQNLRVARQGELRAWADLDLPEAACEAEVLGRGELLVPETMTVCSLYAASMAWNVWSSISSDRSTPTISAPRGAPLGMTCIVPAVDMDQTPHRTLTPWLSVAIIVAMISRHHPTSGAVYHDRGRVWSYSMRRGTGARGCPGGRDR